jgi:hypothetical protein
MSQWYRIAGWLKGPHYGHFCTIVPLKAKAWLKPELRDAMGKSLVECECGVRLVLPTRNLRKC